jgi:hypothetical protein
MSLKVELQQFVDSIKKAGADGAYTADEIHLAARELADCVAPLIDALGGDAAAVDALAADVVEAANLAIDALPDGKWGAKSGAKMAVTVFLPNLVKQAATAGKPAHQWIQENVVPRLRNWEHTLHSLVVAFSE